MGTYKIKLSYIVVFHPSIFYHILTYLTLFVPTLGLISFHWPQQCNDIREIRCSLLFNRVLKHRLYTFLSKLLLLSSSVALPYTHIHSAGPCHSLTFAWPLALYTDTFHTAVFPQDNCDKYNCRYFLTLNGSKIWNQWISQSLLCLFCKQKWLQKRSKNLTINTTKQFIFNRITVKTNNNYY